MPRIPMQQELNQCSVLSNLAILIVRGLDHAGHDGRKVLDEAGIDYDFATVPDARLPLNQYHRLWRLAVETSNDPCFGLVVARNLQPADLHGLGLGMLASPTLAHGLRRIVRFARCLSLNSQVTLVEDGDTYVMAGGPLIREMGRVPTMWDFGAAVLVQLCRITLVESLTPSLVTLPREEPGCADRIREYFGCEVHFSTPQIAITFDRDLLDSPLPTANPRLARANEQVVIDYLSEFDQKDVVTRSRAAIIEALPSGRPSEKSIAAAVNMSTRNYRRRLADRGTTFREILDSTRRDLSRQYLTEGERSIAEISFMLGYTEPTNFARWFRQSTGVTPKEFRGEPGPPV